MLRTRAPLYSPLRAFSLDLHVLGTPPAFVLSQDQTLQLRVFDPCQMPLARRWPVIRICVRKLKECGTAFRRRLAIQFSKTEHHPGKEASMPLSQALTVAGSRRPVLRRGGK